MFVQEETLFQAKYKESSLLSFKMYSRRARPSREILLSLSATHLHDKDLFSKSDPYAVVYREENGIEEEIGRTETLKDNLNPTWTKKIKICENLKTVRIAVFDQDSKSKKTSVRTIIYLSSKIKYSRMTIIWEKSSSSFKCYCLQVFCEKLHIRWAKINRLFRGRNWGFLRILVLLKIRRVIDSTFRKRL